MTIINVMVDDQRLEFSSMPVVASEGVKETYVKFALSSDWSGFGATALFYRDDSPEDVYTSVLDGAGLAEVPYEITAAPGWIRFGLSGSDGTSVHTSEILKYKIVKGKYTSGQSSEPPAPGIYEQMLAIAGQMRDTLNAAVIEQNAIIQGLVTDMDDLRSDMETEQTTFESVVTGQINTLVNNFAGSSRETVLFEGSHTVNIGDEIDLVSDPTVYDYLDIVLNDGMVGTIIGPTQNSQWRVTGETVKSTGTSVTTYVIEGVLDAQSLCLRVSTACAIVDTGTASTRYDLSSGPIADESLRRYCLKVIGRKLTDDAEVLNIRVGADGVTYQTAGTAVRSQLDKKLNAPISGGTVDYGTSGQLLATDGQGNTEWVDSVIPDGSITVAKLAPGVIDTTYLIQGAAASSVTVGQSLASKANAADVTAIDGRVSDLESVVNVMEGAFDTETIDITPSESTSGKFVSADGVPTDSASCSYKTIPIGSNLVDKTLSISGTSWINVRPYVFVGASGNISFPSTYDSSPTQYTDIPFVPNEFGTLYINVYASGSRIHIGKVTYDGITDTIDVDAIPVDEIVNEIKDATSFEIVNLGTLITSKLLNGNTGEITDGTNQIQRVTDYITVTPNTAYLITTESNYSRGLYAWYDENKVFISGAVAASGSTYTHLYGERVTSPKDAAYIVIGFIYQNPYPFPILMKGNMTSAIPSKRWTGKKWTIIGDSLSASYAVTGIHYHELIVGATGISRNNLSVSGTGYARGSSSFMTQALSVPVDSDVVTIFGSGNDASAGLDLGIASDTGTDTIAGCINTTIDNLISVKPIMQVGIITPTPWHNNMPYDNGWMEQYSNLIVEICKRRSIPCLDLFHCTGLDTNNSGVISGAYSHDGGNATHLDEVGQNFITPRILHFMESLLIH